MSQDISLIAALQQYIEQCHLDELSPRTIEGKKSNLQLFVKWYIVNVGLRVSDLSVEGIKQFMKYLHTYREPQNKKLIEKATRRNKITAVRMFCLFLYRNEYINVNFAEKVQTPKAGKNITQAVLQPDEVAAIANQTAFCGDKGIRDAAMLAVFYSCGLRRGDVINIKLNGISVEAKLLFVPNGKGDKDRIVPIAQEALDLVLNYKNAFRPKLVNFESGDYLFLDDKGKQFRGHQVTRLVNRYKHRAGVSKPGASNLYRHTTATTLLDNGADLLTVRNILGHASVSTTQVYTHIAVKKISEDYQQYHPSVQNPNLYIPAKYQEPKKIEEQ
ncbi:tyrosine-type recombinase/integrase [Pseudoalteromonas xiamenensis]